MSRLWFLHCFQTWHIELIVWFAFEKEVIPAWPFLLFSFSPVCCLGWWRPAPMPRPPWTWPLRAGCQWLRCRQFPGWTQMVQWPIRDHFHTVWQRGIESIWGKSSLQYFFFHSMYIFFYSYPHQYFFRCTSSCIEQQLVVSKHHSAMEHQWLYYILSQGSRVHWNNNIPWQTQSAIAFLNASQTKCTTVTSLQTCLYIAPKCKKEDNVKNDKSTRTFVPLLGSLGCGTRLPYQNFQHLFQHSQ